MVPSVGTTYTATRHLNFAFRSGCTRKIQAFCALFAPGCTKILSFQAQIAVYRHRTVLWCVTYWLFQHVKMWRREEGKRILLPPISKCGGCPPWPRLLRLCISTHLQFVRTYFTKILLYRSVYKTGNSSSSTHIIMRHKRQDTMYYI